MRYGLIGQHVEHSYSPWLHAQLGNSDYTLQSITLEQLDGFMKQRDFLGINVTIPYKQAVIPYLDELDERAKRLQAVNTIVNRDGKLIGYNTDYDGFACQLDRDGIQIEDKRVLVLGNGGAAKAVLAVLQDRHPASLAIVYYKSHPACISYEECYRTYTDAQVIVNTTPVGMVPSTDEMPIDLGRFEQLEAVVDIIYHPLRTQLLIDAMERGIRISKGLAMLTGQAVYADALFRNRKAQAKHCEDLLQRLYRNQQNVVLIGMPGSGKTTLGRALANRLGYQMVDLDEAIEREQHLRIAEIIVWQGEAVFRDLESAMCRRVAKQEQQIISCGGGIILRKENMDVLRRQGLIIWIDRPLEQLVYDDSRPLSSTADAMKELYQKRLPLYRAYADAVVNNDSTIDEAVAKLLRIVEKGRVR